ncbi:hypothetical protein AGMMS49975_09470 [Clostridia bacterium]|nr:hypothetical protein AGMMS49975_09470 [Clostridia bacterium]
MRFAKVAFCTLFTMIIPQAVFASDLFINGVPIAPITESGNYVSIRPVADAIGCNLYYDDTSATIIGEGDFVDFRVIIGSTAAAIDGIATELTEPVRIEGGVTMVPVSFAEQLLPKIETDEKQTIVKITDGTQPDAHLYTKAPIRIPDTDIYVSSNPYQFVSDDKYNKSQADIIVPSFYADLGRLNARRPFTPVNSYFDKLGQDAEDAVRTAVGISRIASETKYFEILPIDDNIITVLTSSESYTGGAHEVVTTNTTNIEVSNITKPVVLGLDDIFNAGYEKTLLSAINTQIGATYRENEVYADIMNTQNFPVKELPKDFYLKDGKLVLMYQPYDIASFSHGIVSFEIPLAQLEGILR